MTTASNFLAQVAGALPQLTPSFHLKDLIDVLVVAFVIYLILIFIKQTRSFFIFSAILILFGVNFVSINLNLSLTRQLFQPLLTFFLVIFVVVFQKEIRRFFDWFMFPGRRPWSARRDESTTLDIPAIVVEAAREMAKRKIGALIVLAGNYPLESLVQGGLALGGQPSVPLLLSIFDPTSPGHDGAVIIEQGTIKSFGAHLPLAENFRDFARKGTRHRAALGIAERTDALVVVVSEERGEISIAQGKELKTLSGPTELEKVVREHLQIDELATGRPGYVFWLRNSHIKIISLILAAIMWGAFSYQTGLINQDFVVPIEFRYLPKELTITKTSLSEVTVTVQGSSRDLLNLDKNAIKVGLDVSQVEPGSNIFELNQGEVDKPPYLQIKNISPKKVSVTVGLTNNQIPVR
jgi:uncharacterized protein (TIGR00159 family)